MHQEWYATLGEVKDGALKVRDRKGFEIAMSRFADGLVEVTVQVAREKRTSAQNRFWHGVVIPLFAEHCGYDPVEMKAALALELLPTEVTNLKTGEIHTVPGHTANLTTREFKDLIDRAQRLGAEMGIVIPDPGAYDTTLQESSSR